MNLMRLLHLDSVLMHNTRGKKIAIFGTSGFAREVFDIAFDVGYREFVFISGKKVLDTFSGSFLGYQIIDEAKIPFLVSNGFEFAIGIGDNKIRKRIAQKYPNLKYVNLLHKTATFGHSQKKLIEEKQGNIIAAGVRITNNVEIGNFCIFNLNCTIGHDCVIEDFVNVAPGANISGNVYLSEGAFIGTNAAVLQGKSAEEKLIIGKFAVVGAGAVVAKNVPHNVIVVGVPAKPLSNNKSSISKKRSQIEHQRHSNTGGGRTRKGFDLHPQSIAA